MSKRNVLDPPKVVRVKKIEAYEFYDHVVGEFCLKQDTGSGKPTARFDTVIVTDDGPVLIGRELDLKYSRGLIRDLCVFARTRPGDIFVDGRRKRAEALVNDFMKERRSANVRP